MDWGGAGRRTVLRTRAAAAARRSMENNQFSGTLASELGALTAVKLL
jgi:hypothetical protein